MVDFAGLFQESANRHHSHLCPRQVLGVRMGLYAAQLLRLELPRSDKRLFTFVESDGCLTDGIAAATRCWWGSRTMYLMDYGKTAATFVDTLTEQAIRVIPAHGCRHRALEYAPGEPDHWHAQLAAYQVMPDAELLEFQPVTLTLSLKKLISHHGGRVVCECCGEDVINERHLVLGGKVLCRGCATNAYYRVLTNNPVIALSQGEPQDEMMARQLYSPA